MTHEDLLAIVESLKDVVHVTISDVIESDYITNGTGNYKSIGVHLDSKIALINKVTDLVLKNLDKKTPIFEKVVSQIRDLSKKHFNEVGQTVSIYETIKVLMVYEIELDALADIISAK